MNEEIANLMLSVCDKEKIYPYANGFWVITQEELEEFSKLLEKKAFKEGWDACRDIRR